MGQEVENAINTQRRDALDKMAGEKRRTLTAEEAAVALARLFSAHCRVDIYPPDLQAMLTAHWTKIAPLAHAIHEDIHR